MPSVAAVLVVRNEVDDISWWIAHHLACGFDKLIIFDDNSDDGTWEVIKTAASIFPIAARRVTSTAQDPVTRRFESYAEAIRTEGERYPWMGFFDSDEYFLTADHTSVSAFLDGFPDADGVAVNWCIFGSSHRTHSPDEPPTEAFQRRAPDDFPDHRLFKSFIRTSAFRGSYRDPFLMDIDPARYVDAGGSPLGPTSNGVVPRWEKARIAHYVTRNRTNSENTDALWQYFDQNDVEDDIARPMIGPTRALASRIAQAQMLALFWQSRPPPRPGNAYPFVRPRMSTPPFANNERIAFYEIVIPDRGTIVFDPTRETMDVSPFGATDEQRQPVRLMLDTYAGIPRTGGILCPPGALPSGQSVLFDLLPVTASPAPDGQTWLLHSPLRALGFFLNEDDSFVYDAAPSRVSLREIPTPEDLPLAARAYLSLVRTGHTFDGFLNGIASSSAPSAAATACAIAHLPSADRERLNEASPGLVPRWLRAN